MLLLLLACSDPPSGDTNPPADAPYAPPVAADCGEGVAPGSVAGLVRWPYLQLVTTDGITVAWGADDTATTARLRVGPDADLGLTWEATGASTSGAPDGRFTLFHARAEGLTPNTEYCYAVEVDGVVLASGLRFRTAPDHPDAPVRFTALGDFGSGSDDQRAVIAAMEPWLDETDLWLTLGDNAYDDGTWSEWHDKVFGPHQDQLHRVPSYLVPGNHDWNTGSLDPFLANLFLPGVESWWSFDYGPVHFVGLDSEMGTLTSGPEGMLEWLEADLAANDQPWTVALWHHPLLTGNPDRTGDPLMASLVAPILQEHGVPLVLVGHDHFYERFEPVRFTNAVAAADPAGFVHVISGGGGRSLYDVEPHELDVVRAERHHFLYVEADAARLRLRAIAEDGEVLDDVELERP